MSEIIEKIKKELSAFEEKRKVLVENLRKEFPTLFKELFDKSELIESVGWTQYNNYFNDGDECPFRVHNDYLYINGEHEEDLDELELEKYEKELDEFKEILQSIPDDFYQELFGNHCQVTITKNGEVKVEGYEHD